MGRGPLRFCLSLALMLGAQGAWAQWRAERLEPLKNAFGASVSTQVEFEIEADRYHDLDLDRGARDAFAFTRIKLTPELLIKPSAEIDLHLEGRWETRRVLHDPADYGSEFVRTRLRSAYVLYQPSDGPWVLQAGRRRFRDDREWLFDEHLDALRVAWASGPFRTELSVSSVVIDPEPGDEVRRVIGFLQYAPAWGTLELFGIDTRVKDSEARPAWYGMRLRARPVQALRVYADAAWRRGRNGDTALRGHGFDLGGTWSFAGAWKPSVTAAYAHGSGDGRPGDGRDTTFRQTGMQDNNGRIAGVETFQYYGTVFDPELSNLSIQTLAAGIRPLPNTSVELVWHGYRRDSANARVRSGLEINPTGAGKDLGQSVELLLGHRTRHTRSSLALGWFKPGRAYVRRDAAFGVAAEFRAMF